MEKKKVTFSNKPPEVHHMIAWSFAYTHARKSEWRQTYLDSIRFKDRIKAIEMVLTPILISKLDTYKKYSV